jgi:DNA repair protein RadC
MGEVASVAFVLVRAAATLYLQQCAEGTQFLSDPQQLSAFWRMRIGELPHEVFEVAYLDSGQRLLRDGIELLEEGTIDRATVYPRRVIASALRRHAAGIVLAHNHPDGDVRPTDHDKLVTRALVLAAETVHLSIIDHLIVSGDDAFSFRAAGLL